MFLSINLPVSSDRPVSGNHIAQALGKAARADDSYDKKLVHFTAPDLLIIDDLGLRPLKGEEPVGAGHGLAAAHWAGWYIETSSLERSFRELHISCDVRSQNIFKPLEVLPEGWKFIVQLTHQTGDKLGWGAGITVKDAKNMNLGEYRIRGSEVCEAVQGCIQEIHRTVRTRALT